MNIPKTAKLGLACAAALSYSVIPTYLLKYRWIFRSRQRASREEKVLYLTFDDGPVAGSARKHPGIVERMRKSGYQVGIHSLSHESAMLSGPGRTGRDVKESKKIMEKMDIAVKWYRPPWGHLNLASLFWIRKLHLNLVFWDVMAQDWSAKETPDSICNKILRRVFPGAIICLHDGRGENGAPGRTIEALKKAIPLLKAQGYEFRRIEEKYGTAGESEID